MKYTPFRISLFFSVALLVVACTRSSYRSPETYERPFRGSATSSVVLIEFSDFQCPACKAVQPLVQSVLAKYPQVRFEYHHFPLRQIHRFAFDAAVAAECAADWGTFWEYHDALFENQPEFSRDDLVTYARNVGLDETSFAQCLASPDPARRVKDDLADAQRRQLQGTPTFFLNGVQVADPQQLDALIAQMLVNP